MARDSLNFYKDLVYYGDNNKFCRLANEQFQNMKKEIWHLLPQAYSITLTPIESSDEDDLFEPNPKKTKTEEDYVHFPDQQDNNRQFKLDGELDQVMNEQKQQEK